MQCLACMGSTLLFRFRSGTHGPNEELGIDIVLGTIAKLVWSMSVSASL